MAGKKKRTAAYAAIHESVMDLRIALSKDGLSAKHADVLLAIANGGSDV